MLTPTAFLLLHWGCVCWSCWQQYQRRQQTERRSVAPCHVVIRCQVRIFGPIIAAAQTTSPELIFILETVQEKNSFDVLTFTKMSSKCLIRSWLVQSAVHHLLLACSEAQQIRLWCLCWLILTHTHKYSYLVNFVNSYAIHRVSSFNGVTIMIMISLIMVLLSTPNSLWKYSWILWIKMVIESFWSLDFHGCPPKISPEKLCIPAEPAEADPQQPGARSALQSSASQRGWLGSCL